MTIRYPLAALLLASAGAAWACTSFLVGKDASTTGSVMITYAADSHTLYGDIAHTPAVKHAPGDMREVREWDTNRYLCHIPQPAETYAVNGNMNEHGLAISESTWGGRPELEGDTGIDYGSLIYIALERAKTAREALEIMTTLPEEYGYASSGESFSIADPNEAWILELIGRGKGKSGIVWVARRLPDNAIAGHANHPRIHQFPTDDPNTLYHPEVISFAREKGYYDGKDEDFSFSLAYGELDKGATRGCDGRVWSFFRHHVNPAQMDAFLPWVLQAEGTPFPLWVVPEHKLSANDLMNDMRDHFEDTPLNMTSDIGAGPWEVPYRFRPMTFTVDGKTYTNERATATQQTGFSFVAELNDSYPELMRGILWFGVDDTNTSVYVPIYAGAQCVPHEFERGNGDLYTLSWDAAFWVTNYVANQAYNRYNLMIEDIRPVQQAQESMIRREVDQLLDVMRDFAPYKQRPHLEEHSARAAARYVKAYKELGDYLFVKYLDGNRKKEKDGKFLRNADGLPASPDFPGYNERYYRSIVDETGDHLRVD